jgi:hypothetical protein
LIDDKRKIKKLVGLLERWRYKEILPELFKELVDETDEALKEAANG